MKVLCLIAVMVVCLGLGLLRTPTVALRSQVQSQQLLAQIISDPAVARGALRESNIALNAAINSRKESALLQAIDRGYQTINNISTVNLQNQLRNELLVTAKLLYQAQGVLLTVLKDACVKGHLERGLVANELLKRLNGTQRQGIGATLLNGVAQGLTGCLRLELLISSLIRNTELQYVVQVDVTVPLKFDPKSGVFSGVGEVKKVAQSMKLEGCKIALTFTKTMFTVTKMTIDLDEKIDFKIADIKLSDYDSGGVLETMTTTCPENSPPPIQFPNWGFVYQTVHYFNNNLKIIENWSIGSPKGAVASKKFTQEAPEDTLVEATDFILRKFR